MPRRQIERNRHCLAPEVRGGRYGARVAPPWIADKMLAGCSQTGQRLGAARFVGEGGEIPPLRLARQLRGVVSSKCGGCFGEAFGDPEIHPRCSQSPAARCLKEQDVEFSRNPPGNPRLNRSEVLWLELMPARPKILRGCRVGYSHVHPQQAGRTCLGAAGNNVIVSTFGDPVAVVRRTAIVPQRLQRESASVPKKVGYEVVGKGFHQILLVGIASQVAHRRDGYRNVWQQTRPARSCRALAWSITLRRGGTPGRTIRRADPRNGITIFCRETRCILLPRSAR